MVSVGCCSELITVESEAMLMVTKMLPAATSVTTTADEAAPSTKASASVKAARTASNPATLPESDSLT